MLTNLQTITIQVRDQDRARDFYVNALGFEVTADNPMDDDSRWLEVALPGAETRLMLQKAAGEVAGGFTGTVFGCDDLQSTYEEFKSRGVDFPVPPRVEPWGKWAQFTDQDGNEFGIWAPPDGAQQ